MNAKPKIRFTAREVAELIGADLYDLRNWRRPQILKGGASNPRYLPTSEGSYEVDVLLEWLRRPANRLYAEHVAAIFAPPVCRDAIFSPGAGLLGLPQPTPDMEQQPC